MATVKTHSGAGCPDCLGDRTMYTIKQDGREMGYCFDCSATWIHVRASSKVRRRPGTGSMRWCI